MPRARRAATGRVRHQRRARVGAALGAQHPEHGAHLVERGLAGLLDAREGIRGLVGLLLHEVQPDAGLHVDLAERVREHVVQLARDAHPLAPAPRSAGAG